MPESIANVNSDQAAEVQFEQQSLENFLTVYYKKFFPYCEIYRWLNYGREADQPYFSRREFSFTLKNDIYLRYKSFVDHEALKKSLISNVPYKIDIGAVYEGTFHSNDFKAVEREFVIDIDMTDYDDVRLCCKEASICQNCWRFMVVAKKILDRSLREEFGYKHILWVYSGRRGIHAWICDRNARILPRNDREAIINFLGYVKKSKHPGRIDCNVDVENPSVQKILKILEAYVDEMFIDRQKWASSEDFWKKVLEMSGRETDSARQELQRRLDNYPLGEERWRAFREILRQLKGKFKRFMTLYEEIIFYYMYPRLDVHVSTTLNHLLKAPYSVHPKTGRISVPIPDIDTFDPFKVPSVQQLCEGNITLKEYNDCFTKFINEHFREWKTRVKDITF